MQPSPASAYTSKSKSGKSGRLNLAPSHRPHDRHAHGGGDSLAERAGGRLDAARPSVLGVSWAARVELPEGLEVVEGHRRTAQHLVLGVDRADTGQVQERPEEGGGVALGEHEAVAVRPDRIGGVEAQKPLPQGVRDGRHPHRRSGVPRIRLLHRVHAQSADRVHRQRVQVGHGYAALRALDGCPRLRTASTGLADRGRSRAAAVRWGGSGWGGTAVPDTMVGRSAECGPSRSPTSTSLGSPVPTLNFGRRGSGVSADVSAGVSGEPRTGRHCSEAARAGPRSTAWRRWTASMRAAVQNVPIAAAAPYAPVVVPLGSLTVPPSASAAPRSRLGASMWRPVASPVPNSPRGPPIDAGSPVRCRIGRWSRGRR